MPSPTWDTFLETVNGVGWVGGNCVRPVQPDEGCDNLDPVHSWWESYLDQHRSTNFWVRWWKISLFSVNPPAIMSQSSFEAAAKYPMPTRWKGPLVHLSVRQVEPFIEVDEGFDHIRVIQTVVIKMNDSKEKRQGWHLYLAEEDLLSSKEECASTSSH